MVKILSAFIKHILASTAYEESDYQYLQNRILSLVGEEALSHDVNNTELLNLIDEFVSLACQSGKISDTLVSKEQLATQLIDLSLPCPSQINQRFWNLYERSPESALTWFYDLSCQKDIIKTREVAKNEQFTVETDFGQLVVTINLSKPEKDPKMIAQALKQLPKDLSYPACQLCFENEGYSSNEKGVAKLTHRIIRFELLGKEWGFHYSPYAYFKEHCIFLSKEHRPMTVSKQTFEELLSLVEMFPDYFVGSNADLPIVGGSILSHHHYQAGRYRFPMDEAPLAYPLSFKGYEGVEAGILKWPLSVIRLKSEEKDELVALADKILQAWRGYSDPQNQLYATSSQGVHHTITPIARQREGAFELDLVLRSNLTSDTYPDGIFHPHPDVHHIKKENIGLIEVLGLAILPPRLKRELQEVEEFLLGKRKRVAAYHQKWANQLKEDFPNLSKVETYPMLQKKLGQIFCRILEDAGVFKWSPQGQEGFMAFLKTLDINETSNS